MTNTEERFSITDLKVPFEIRSERIDAANRKGLHACALCGKGMPRTAKTITIIAPAFDLLLPADHPDFDLDTMSVGSSCARKIPAGFKHTITV